MTDTRATTGSLVILGASERAARLAEKLPCAVVHLVRPGGDVGMLARGDASYYSVDYTDHGFAEFCRGGAAAAATRRGRLTGGDGSAPGRARQ